MCYTFLLLDLKMLSENTEKKFFWLITFFDHTGKGIMSKSHESFFSEFCKPGPSLCNFAFID